VANARLEHLNQLKSDFLAFISHELRTPLNAMSAVGLFDPAGDSAEQAQVIELVREGYDGLNRFVQKGLDYFQWLAVDRVEDGSEIDLGCVVERATARVPGLRAPGTEFELRAETGRCRVRGRAEALTEAVQILVENALKHSRAEKRVVVEVRERGEFVTLSVADRGVGLRPEMLREIFRPFTSGDAVHHSGGSGLNLALAQRIIEAHAGTIRAESDGPGTGATFTIELPAATGSARPVAAGAQR
jgi:signal transduction histidine kinase